MPAFLSDGWFEHVRASAEPMPPLSGASLRMQHVVSGAPGGKVQCVVELRDGKVTEAERGRAADAACTITWAYADALAVLRGQLDLDVAIMRGDVKLDGDYIAFVLGLRPVFASEAGAAFVQRVAAATTEG